MLDYTQTAITLPKPTWDWVAIREVPIEPSDDALISLNYLPTHMLVSPQYALQKLPGSEIELYARPDVQAKLVAAAKLLPTGYKLVLLDAWRSIDTQQALFDQMCRFVKRDYPDYTPEEVQQAALRIVALPSLDPKKPSPHNTGGSIDLSIVDTEGRLLNMGSPFDDISERARTDYYEQNATTPEEITARNNRRLLYHIMTSVGFTNYAEEWWHFDYGNQNWAWVSDEPHALYSSSKPVYAWVD